MIMYFKNTPIVKSKVTFKIGIIFYKVYAVIPRFWQKTLTCPAGLFPFPSSENLDVISQCHLGFYLDKF